MNANRRLVRGLRLGQTENWEPSVQFPNEIARIEAAGIEIHVKYRWSVSTDWFPMKMRRGSLINFEDEGWTLNDTLENRRVSCAEDGKLVDADRWTGIWSNRIGLIKIELVCIN